MKRVIVDGGRVESVAMVGQQLGKLPVPMMARGIRITEHGSCDRDRLQLGLTRIRQEHIQGGQGVGGQADPVCAGEEVGDGFDRHDLGPAFGQELTEGVIETEIRPVSLALGRTDVDGSARGGQAVHRVGEIARVLAKASERARPSAAVAPRGQKSNPTTRLTAQPMATSSTLVRPTLQPVGSMMLKRMMTTTLKPACPAANEIIDGAIPETRTATGRRTHRSTA